MTILKRRDRLVVFRLTQDEYKRLQKACSGTGARNLSDFTRAQLLTRTDGDLEVRLSDFERRLADLQTSIRRMSRLLKRMAEPESKLTEDL